MTGRATREAPDQQPIELPAITIHPDEAAGPGLERAGYARTMGTVGGSVYQTARERRSPAALEALGTPEAKEVPVQVTGSTVAGYLVAESRVVVRRLRDALLTFQEAYREAEGPGEASKPLARRIGHLYAACLRDTAGKVVAKRLPYAAPLVDLGKKVMGDITDLPGRAERCATLTAFVSALTAWTDEEQIRLQSREQELAALLGGATKLYPGSQESVGQVPSTGDFVAQLGLAWTAHVDHREGGHLYRGGFIEEEYRVAGRMVRLERATMVGDRADETVLRMALSERFGSTPRVGHGELAMKRRIRLFKGDGHEAAVRIAPDGTESGDCQPEGLWAYARHYIAPTVPIGELVAGAKASTNNGGPS